MGSSLYPAFDEGVETLRVALLEDDEDQAALVERWLEHEGISVTVFETGTALLQSLRRDSYDLLMLDWMVPDLEGIEVLHKVRQSTGSPVPIMFVTARDQERDIVQALESGADDYLTKPLRRSELLARIHALVRRSLGPDPKSELHCPPYQFDIKAKSLSLDGKPVKLTEREFDLALFMFRREGKVVSREHLLDAVWGLGQTGITTRTVDTHMSRLRKKLKLGQDVPWRLTAVYQHGYRLEQVESATNGETDNDGQEKDE